MNFTFSWQKYFHKPLLLNQYVTFSLRSLVFVSNVPLELEIHIVSPPCYIPRYINTLVTCVAPSAAKSKLQITMKA